MDNVDYCEGPAVLPWKALEEIETVNTLHTMRTVFIRLLAAADFKPYEMVLNINVSRTWTFRLPNLWDTFVYYSTFRV